MSIFAQQGGLGVAKNQTGIRKNNVFFVKKHTEITNFQFCKGITL